jgi:hypothetical protein
MVRRQFHSPLQQQLGLNARSPLDGVKSMPQRPDQALIFQLQRTQLMDQQPHLLQHLL